MEKALKAYPASDVDFTCRYLEVEVRILRLRNKAFDAVMFYSQDEADAAVFIDIVRMNVDDLTLQSDGVDELIHTTVHSWSKAR